MSFTVAYHAKGKKNVCWVEQVGVDPPHSHGVKDLILLRFDMIIGDESSSKILERVRGVLRCKPKNMWPTNA